MHRIMLVTMAVAAVLAGSAVPAAASPGTGPASGFTPVPIPPFDGPAGLLCDFAVHYDPIVSEVEAKVLATYPDGSTKRQLALGPLILNVSNAQTGASEIVDASGTAVMDFGQDGSMVWHVDGPVIARLPGGSSNLPRGLYAINGVYTVTFSPTGFKTITLEHGTIHNLCDDLG
jgi:hypothetical protein